MRKHKLRRIFVLILSLSLLLGSFAFPAAALDVQSNDDEVTAIQARLASAAAQYWDIIRRNNAEGIGESGRRIVTGNLDLPINLNHIPGMEGITVAYTGLTPGSNVNRFNRSGATMWVGGTHSGTVMLPNPHAGNFNMQFNMVFQLPNPNAPPANLTVTVPVFLELVALPLESREDLSLWREFAEHFWIGTFGDWQGAHRLHHFRTNSPGNIFKLDAMIGTSATNSRSRQAFVAARDQVLAAEGITLAQLEALPAEQRDALLFSARTNVIINSSDPAINPEIAPNAQPQIVDWLDGLQEWNEANPDDQKFHRGHVFVWHSGQNPAYFFTEDFFVPPGQPWTSVAASREVMLARIDDYIYRMTRKYSAWSDVIFSWDVANEVIDCFTGHVRNMEGHQAGQWGHIFRRADLDCHPFVPGAPPRVCELDCAQCLERLYYESEFVRHAFERSRYWSEYFGANWYLDYNDFMDSNKPYEPKLTRTIRMLEPIYAAGNIDGFGMQGRLAAVPNLDGSGTWVAPSMDMIREHIELGLTVANHVLYTEADVRMDFVQNPFFDPSRPTTHIRYRGQQCPCDCGEVIDWPNWPYGSGLPQSVSGHSPGNTWDVDNSPVMRNPNWAHPNNQDIWAEFPGSSPHHIGLQFDEQLRNDQADFIADWMDLLIEFGDRVHTLALDGNNDSFTFNRLVGATLWDWDNTPKPAFFAAIGAPIRNNLRETIASGPDASLQFDFTADSWANYVAAVQQANAFMDVRVRDMDAIIDLQRETVLVYGAINQLVPLIVFNGSNPNVLGAHLEEGDVILETAGNLGIFSHHSPFVIPEGRTLTVVTTLNVQGNAELIIEGTLVVLDGGRVNNQGGAGGTIRIIDGGTLVNYGHVENVTNSTVINYGTIENNGRFEVRASTRFHSCDGYVIGEIPLNIHRNALTCDNG